MTKMNKAMDPAYMSRVTQQFSQEHTKLGIKAEMSMSNGEACANESTRLSDVVGDTLDAAFGEDGDSEEEDAIVNQVLDEIGISFNERVRWATSKSCVRRRCFSLSLDGHCSACSRRTVGNGLEPSTDEPGGR